MDKYTASNAAAPAYLGQIQSATTGYMDSKPSPPTRFSQCSGRLEAQAAHLGGLVDRVVRATDRLGGSVPSPAEDKKLRGNGGHVAAQIEQSIEDIDNVIRRFENVLERLEAL